MCPRSLAYVVVIHGNSVLQIDEDPTAGVPIATAGIPICVTFYQIGKSFLVDVDLDEECCATSRILVCERVRARRSVTFHAHFYWCVRVEKIGINRSGSVVAITTSGVTVVSPVDLRGCVEVSHCVRYFP